jgi:hypothetical protein
MPIVADFYTRLYRPEAVTVKDAPLFDALNQLCDTMRMRWNKEAGGAGTTARGEASGWLQFRSASFFHDRLKEVPNRLLAHWAASRKEHGTLTLDDLIEIALLSDAQLDAVEMAEGAREIWGLTEWGLARSRSARPHLRFMAQLTSLQRQEAAGGEGLAFTKMTLAQQQQFISLIAGPEGEPSQSLEELAGAALRVDYAPEGSFEWRRTEGDHFALSVPGGRGGRPDGLGMIEPPAVRERTREAALQAARRIDPNATEAQIAPTQAALMIMYTTAGPQGRVPLMTLRATAGNTSVTANRVGG